MSRNMVGLALLLIVAMFGMAWMWRPTSGEGLLPYRNSAATAQGAGIYANNCASCHGTDLQGEPDWRRPDSEGYLPAPPHDQTGHTWHHPDAQLIAITRLGTETLVGGNYRSRMAGFDDILSEDEILAVLAYIKSTWPEQVIDQHNRINAAASGG